jgi:acyl-CoA reductase-like NAD-dependent aldehyde dehydrogenase
VSATIIQLGTDLSGKKSTSDFVEISEHIQNGAKHLKDLGIDGIISLLDEYAKALQKSNVRSMEGVPFLFMWLRKSNLEKMITQSFPDPTILTGFVGERRKKIKAQPRGVVCHWIAGNVPTLGLFSLFQSMLVGNANILRVPKESIDMIKQLLKIMADSKAADLMDSFSVVTFPSSDKTLNSNLSMVADARIIWGGKESVEAITGLPRQSHCEDIVFGPKYSFAVMDDEALK